MVDAILDHPDIKAVSFVGSSDIAHYIYSRGTANGKRVQAFGGAKNHGIVMPDADLDQVVNDLAGAAFGSAGERCMALPVVVPVGDEDRRRAAREADPGDREPARRRLDRPRRPLRPGGQRRAQAARSRTTSRWAPTRAASWCVDGRGFTLQGHEKGFFIGPTLFDHVKPDMSAPTRKRSSGPVLQIVRADDFEEAVRAAERAPVRQRRRHLHPQRPRRARVRRPRQCRHGRHQRADPGAGRLSHLRRLEALGLRRHQPARHGRRPLLDQDQDHHPALARRRRRTAKTPSSSRRWADALA